MAPAKSRSGPRRRKRLKREQRYDSILDAARRAFTETGDIGRTSMRTIAAKAGINEALIYQHFANKDELVTAAIIGPLEEAIQLIRRRLDIAAPRDVTEWAVSGRESLQQIVETMTEIGPLLGLVLFGEQQSARRFYNRVLVPEWTAIETYSRRYFGSDFPYHAFLLAMWGTALLIAADAKLNETGPDAGKLVDEVIKLMVKGFYFPARTSHAAIAPPAPRRRRKA